MKNLIISLLLILFISCQKEEILPDNKLKDIDGNVYTSISIGNQTWMVENLRTTKLNDGTPISNIKDNSEWKAVTYPGYCVYGNNENNRNKYGLIYNFHSMKSDKICPDGWRVATKEDWNELKEYLGKDAAWSLLNETGWEYTHEDKYDFSALPGGYRGKNAEFVKEGDHTAWWTKCDKIEQYTSIAIEIDDYYGIWNTLNPNNTDNTCGFYIRCIKK